MGGSASALSSLNLHRFWLWYARNICGRTTKSATPATRRMLIDTLDASLDGNHGCRDPRCTEGHLGYRSFGSAAISEVPYSKMVFKSPWIPAIRQCRNSHHSSTWQYIEKVINSTHRKVVTPRYVAHESHIDTYSHSEMPWISEFQNRSWHFPKGKFQNLNRYHLNSRSLRHALDPTFSEHIGMDGEE